MNFLEIEPCGAILKRLTYQTSTAFPEVLQEVDRMKISELLNQDLIKVGLEGDEKEEVFEELIDLLVRQDRLADRDAARQAILTREEKQSTGIGRGVAIPHGKSGTITQLTAALGISSEGIEYDSLDGEPVRVVFLLLAEEGNPGPVSYTHLTLPTN